jgi:hypothetical protein
VVAPCQAFSNGALIRGRKQKRKEPGLWRKKARAEDPDLKVADFAYENPKLAALIVKAWKDDALRDKLTDHKHPNDVQTELQTADIQLANPVIITEDEYDEGWELDRDDQVVFVLPNKERVRDLTLADNKLLETAKLLMACVPNGI